MLRIAIDEKGQFDQALTDLAKRQVPFATMQALNQTAYDTRQRWAEVMPRIFDRPTSLTLKAVLYTKASMQKLFADVFIRDEAHKGTPPSKYLQAQVLGGSRKHKGFEKRLQAIGVLPPGMFAVPSKSAKLDIYGNLPGRQIVAILSALGAQRDPLQNETPVSRKRRGSRKTRTGEYFAIKTPRGKLRRGVYQRFDFGFGSAVRGVLYFVNRVSYRKRYDIYGMARKIFDRRFAANFSKALATALQSARAKGWQ